MSTVKASWFFAIVILSFFINGCSAKKNNSYLDPSLPPSERVDDLMQKMTLEEKVAQMCQYVGLEHMKEAEHSMSADELVANDAKGFYPNLHSNDVAKMTEEGKIGSFLHVLTAEEANHLQTLALKSRLKIPLLIGIDAIHGNGLVKGATLYPTPIGMAATFDPQLIKEIGKQTALEMRATGSHWAFTPNIDIARDARWGRVGETFGEDPLLVGDLGVAMVEGLQQGDFTGDKKVIACIKHLIAGSEPANGLNASPMDVSERTLREVFLPAYKRAVESGAFSIMAAHNELNGVPCHANKWLMEDVMRDEFGFEGFIVSDWMDIERIHTLHKVAKDLDEAFLVSVNAGMDMHMHGPHFLEGIVKAVQEGKLSERRIDQSVEKILTAKFKLGLFENPFVDIEKSKDILFQKDHQDLALDVARKSIVLLKNENSFLPIKNAEIKNILVTGPNANNQSITGDWSSFQPQQNIVTIAEGIQEVAPKETKVTVFDSGETIGSIKEAKIKEAGRLAKNVDLAVVVVGENSMRFKWKDKTNGENKGRAKIDLGGKQLDLIKEIHATGTPVIIILVSGRPLGIPWVVDNIPVIVNAWEPGSYGGQAVAEILFGKVNPSGKLPISMPRSVGQIQSVYNHKPSQYFHKYVFEKTGALYHFGYGLSFSNFEYDELRITHPEMDKSGKTNIQFRVSNTGSLDGEEVVQLYIRDDFSSVTRPVKELKAYQRTFIKAGESKRIDMEITPDMLAFYNAEMEYVVEPGAFTIMVGGSSRDLDLHKISLEVVDR